ncbi:helix-turn-helix DNA binding domain protein [Microbacterium phage Phinky]|nr:helix-turn-helix DNA binding domain protein [Microbacterium phage Phinky]
MAKRDRPRYIPPRLGQRDFARTAMVPRWFTREAVAAFRLTPYDFAAFTVIADNLDSHGISTTAMTLIATRGGMSEGGAAKAVNRLIAVDLIHELDPRRKGHIMRYGIAPDIPWTETQR